MSWFMPQSSLSTCVLAMHAPDGLFSMPVNIVFAVVDVLVLAVAVKTLSRRNDHRLAPTMGVMAAFIFAAQMVNFPIASGTTGHLLGGTLAAILLGPWAGTVVMAAVVTFQALLGDGGITVLGPNVFNMGVVGACLAYLVYRAIVGRSAQRPARVVAASCFAAWLAVVLASAFASLQLAVSGTASLHRALAAMVGTHMLIGLGEALITAGVVGFILKTRPDLLHDRAATEQPRLTRGAAVVGLGASLFVAAVLSLLPTLWDYPDGLESVGQQKGFLAEECQRDDTDRLLSLPAYPLGVRLEIQDAHVVAAHPYADPTGPIHEGDVIDAIDGSPATDLEAVATALRFDEAGGRFGIEPGRLMNVTLTRAGRQEVVSVAAAGAPRAGALQPLIALMPDYTVPGVGGLVSTSLAGVIGACCVCLLSMLVGRLFTRSSRLETAFAAETGKRPASDGK